MKSRSHGQTLPALDFHEGAEVHHLPYEFGMAQFHTAQRALDMQLTPLEFAWADTEPAPL